MRHGPLLEVDPDSVHMQHLFWSQCAIGFVLDYRKFFSGLSLAFDSFCMASTRNSYSCGKGFTLLYDSL